MTEVPARELQPPGPVVVPACRVCLGCGLLLRLPEIPAGMGLACPRCGHQLPTLVERRRWTEWAFSTALAALILFPPAVIMPILTIDRFGHHHESGILEGCLSLYTDGHIGLAALIFLCSLVFPVLKLAGLVVISSPWFLTTRHHRARTYRFIELVGRWGMLDVLLVAVLVAAVKISDLVEVHPGPGALLFAACVILSLAASACFDSHLIWEDEE